MTLSGEKLYVCNTCGKLFRRLNALKYNDTTHTGDKLNICNTCENAFINSGNLKRHTYLPTLARNRMYVIRVEDRSPGPIL